jgi:hypothetical protein
MVVTRRSTTGMVVQSLDISRSEPRWINRTHFEPSFGLQVQFIAEHDTPAKEEPKLLQFGICTHAFRKGFMLKLISIDGANSYNYPNICARLFHPAWVIRIVTEMRSMILILFARLESSLFIHIFITSRLQPDNHTTRATAVHGRTHRRASTKWQSLTKVEEH